MKCKIIYHTTLIEFKINGQRRLALYIYVSLTSTLIYEECSNNNNFLVAKIARLDWILFHLPTKKPGLGDFNINLLDHNYTIVCLYIEIVTSNGYEIINKINPRFVTRICGRSWSRTILDHVLCDKFTSSIHLLVDDIHISDHKYMFSSVNLYEGLNDSQAKDNFKYVLDYNSLEMDKTWIDIEGCKNFAELIYMLQRLIDRRTMKFVKNNLQ